MRFLIRNMGFKLLPEALAHIEAQDVFWVGGGERLPKRRYVVEVADLPELLELIKPYGGCDLSTQTYELPDGTPLEWEVGIRDEDVFC